ncbi:hypothetical protein ACQ4PT_004857 [Festuca glaucescens]
MATPGDDGDGLDGGRRGGHRDDDGDNVMEFCGISNPLARDVSLFPAAASALAKVWKERPADSHRWTSSIGGVDLDDEVWDVRFHLDGKDNLERQLGRSDITYMKFLAMLEIEGYGRGDSMYYVREEGAGIAGMALIKSMVDVEEMLDLYEDAKCVSITVTKGKSGVPADINRKQCEEQIPISKIGVPVVYSVDMQGVLTQQSNYHLVHVDTGEDYVLTKKIQVLVITKDSDDDDLNEKTIDLKKKRPVETFKRKKIEKDMYSSLTRSQSFQTPPNDSKYNSVDVKHTNNFFGHRDEDGDNIMEFCGTSNPLARDVSLFPAAASALAKVWKERPADSHRWTSSLGGVDLDDEVWDVRFHLYGKDDLERQLGRSDITYMNLLAMLEIEGYGRGDSMYYVREEGACIAGMALIKSMVDVEEMLDLYEVAECVSNTVTKGKSGLPADINRKQCEEQIPISEIGVPVVYSVDIQGVMTQQSNYHLVHVDTGEDYVLTQKSQVPVIPKDSDDDDLNEKTIDLKKKRPVETFKRKKIEKDVVW